MQPEAIALARMEASSCEQLEYSVRAMILDDSPMEEMSDNEPLEHSVLDAAVTCRRCSFVFNESC